MLRPLLAVAFGLFTGVSLGGIGGGGSILAVPILIYALGLGVPQATTTSLLIVGLIALSGAVSHLRAGTANLKRGALFALAGAPATRFGTVLAFRVEARVTLLLFGLLMLAVAALMWRPVRPREGRRSGVLALLVTASAVGLLTGFFGVGGGFVIVPSLVLVLRVPILEAVGTSLVVITLMSAVSLASRLTAGSLDLVVAAPFVGGGVLGAWLGRRWAARVPAEAVRRAFAVAILILGAFVVIRNA